MNEDSRTRSAFDLLTSSRGDAEAYRRICNRNSEALFNFAYHLTHSREISYEVTSETFARVYGSMQGLDASSYNFQADLFRTAWSLALDPGLAWGHEGNARAEVSGFLGPDGQVSGGADCLPAHVGDFRLPESLSGNELITTLLTEVALLPEDTVSLVIGTDTESTRSILMAARLKLKAIGYSFAVESVDPDRVWARTSEKLYGPSPADGTPLATPVSQNQPVLPAAELPTRKFVSRKGIAVTAILAAFLLIGVGVYFILAHTAFAQKIVPSCTGLRESEAKTRAIHAGLKTSFSLRDSNVPRTGNEVVSEQSPESGRKVKKGTTIRLVLEDKEMESARKTAQAQLATANGRLAELQGLGVNTADLAIAITNAQQRFDSAKNSEQYVGQNESSTFWANTVIQQCDARKAAYLAQKERERQAAERVSKLKAAIIGNYTCITTNEESLNFSTNGTFTYEGEGAIHESGTYKVGDGYVDLMWASGSTERMTTTGATNSSGRPTLKSTYPGTNTTATWEPF